MTSFAPSILLIGNLCRTEFRGLRTDLECLGPVTHLPEVETACHRLNQIDPPSLIVLAQAHSGQFSSSQIDALRRAMPLARIVVVLGRWCEGELRTGTPLPGTIRVAWHQFRAATAREFARWSCQQASPWSLPVTAGDEERYLLSAEQPLPRGEGRVGIFSHVRPLRDLLADACRQAGHEPVDLCPGETLPDISEPPPVAVIDLPDGLEAAEQLLTAMRASYGPVRVVALVDSPRAEDLPRFERLGVVAWLAKPFDLDDLDWHLASALS